jgi:hypothetical protein
MWQATKATGMIKSASMKAYEAPGCAFQVLQTGTPSQPSNAIRERGQDWHKAILEPFTGPPLYRGWEDEKECKANGIRKDEQIDNLGWLEWVIWRKVNGHKEYTTSKWAVSWAHNCCLPVEHIISNRTCTHA